MGSLPLAFSVHHFINSVGADAGFASIIGLAILILLYFAHARETANLRNHAQEAAERIQSLEARVAQMARAQTQAPAAQQPAQVPPAAARTATAATPAAARAAAGGVPAAPAGVAAPALTAATKLIPTPVPVALASAPPPAPSPPPPSPPQPPDATVIGAAPVVAPTTTAAGTANGATQDPPTRPPRPVPAPIQTAPPRIQMRGSASPPSARRPGGRAPAQRSFGGGPLLLALVGVLVLAGVIAAVFILTNNGGNSSSASSTHRTNAARAGKGTRSAAVAPSSVTVAVLNGTATSGLAHRVALKLSGDGYKEGTVATATDQTKTTTTVAYLPGFRRDAVAVAGSLKLGQGAVAPVDQPTRSVACPPPSACAANVVVTVGADLANTQ